MTLGSAVRSFIAIYCTTVNLEMVVFISHCTGKIVMQDMDTTASLFFFTTYKKRKHLVFTAKNSNKTQRAALALTISCGTLAHI